MSTEAKAQILIDILLLEAGWRLLDGVRSPASVSLDMQVKVNKSRFP